MATVSLPTRTYSSGKIAYYVAVHVLGFLGTWYAYAHASWTIIAFAIAYFYYGAFAITCMTHRLYTHGSYRASDLLQYLMTPGCAAVVQGRLLWWVGKHTTHHANEDSIWDPHSPHYGFFHSHMGWLMTEEGTSAPDIKYVRHLRPEKYPALFWHDRNYWWLMPLMAIGVPLIGGYLLGDALGGLLVAGFARLMWQYHLTWIVNSAGHKFGTLGKHGKSTDLPILAMITVGESYHAGHHGSQRSYRFGKYDPGYFLIRLFMLLRLAHEHRRPA